MQWIVGIAAQTSRSTKEQEEEAQPSSEEMSATKPAVLDS